MSDMILFSETILSQVADFLNSEPIIYLFGMICLCFVVKVFFKLFSII